MHDVQTVFVESTHQAHRWSGASAHDAHWRRKFPAPRISLQRGEYAKPNRGYAARESHVFLLDQVEDAFGVHVGTRKNEFRANHNAGVGEAPGVGMKHRCDREHRVVVADRKGIGHGTGEGVQNQSAVGVNHSFGESSGAGGEAHCGAVVFVEFWVLKVIAGAGQQVLVTEKSGRDLTSAVSGDDHTLESNVLAKLLVNGKQYVIDDQKTGARVRDDSRYLVGVKSKIHGVQNP